MGCKVRHVQPMTADVSWADAMCSTAYCLRAVLNLNQSGRVRATGMGKSLWLLRIVWLTLLTQTVTGGRLCPVPAGSPRHLATARAASETCADASDPLADLPASLPPEAGGNGCATHTSNNAKGSGRCVKPPASPTPAAHTSLGRLPSLWE